MALSLSLFSYSSLSAKTAYGAEALEMFHLRQELNTHLIQMVKEERTNEILRLLKMGADVNAKDKKGDTPLHYAKRKRHKEAVSLLKSAGAKTNWFLDIFG